MADRTSAVFVVTLVITIIGTVFVVLRLISRGLVVKKLTGADALVFLAWVSLATLRNQAWLNVWSGRSMCRFSGHHGSDAVWFGQA